jgi:antitoxin ParD1/3/4
MNVSIEGKLQKFIEEKVNAGAYRTADEAVNRLLSFVVEQETFEAEQLEELRKQIAVGIEAADRGDVLDWDPEDVWREVERRHSEEAKKAG